jgi:lipopolysaccharide export system protein LptC
MPSLRQRVLALTMAVIGAFAWWMQPDKAPPARDKDPRDHHPDYTVDNFTVTEMGESGTPDRRLVATELRHYSDDNTKELEGPKLTLFEDAGPPWLVRSKSAWISADNNQILLRGDVHIDRERGETTREAHLQTSELLLKRNEHYAETDSPVKITSAADWTTADKGARIWLKDKLRVELLGRVRGTMAFH